MLASLRVREILIRAVRDRIDNHRHSTTGHQPSRALGVAGSRFFWSTLVRQQACLHPSGLPFRLLQISGPTGVSPSGENKKCHTNKNATIEVAPHRRLTGFSLIWICSILAQRTLRANLTFSNGAARRDSLGSGTRRRWFLRTSVAIVTTSRWVTFPKIPGRLSSSWNTATVVASNSGAPFV